MEQWELELTFWFRGLLFLGILGSQMGGVAFQEDLGTEEVVEMPACYLYILANLTDSIMFGLVFRCSSQFLMHVWDAGLGTVLSVSLNVFYVIGFYIMWRKLSPGPENVEW